MLVFYYSKRHFYRVATPVPHCALICHRPTERTRPAVRRYVTDRPTDPSGKKRYCSAARRLSSGDKKARKRRAFFTFLFVGKRNSIAITCSKFASSLRGRAQRWSRRALRFRRRKRRWAKKEFTRGGRRTHDQRIRYPTMYPTLWPLSQGSCKRKDSSSFSDSNVFIDYMYTAHRAPELKAKKLRPEKSSALTQPWTQLPPSHKIQDRSSRFFLCVAE